MKIDYEDLMDQGQQLSAEIDLLLKSRPRDKDLKTTQEFLADRQVTLLFLLDG